MPVKNVKYNYRIFKDNIITEFSDLLGGDD